MPAPTPIITNPADGDTIDPGAGPFSLAWVAASLALTWPRQYHVFQRSGSTGSITIKGTYLGTPGSIEARFNGGAWATLDAAPTGGVFSGTLSGQAQGQGTLEVRCVDAPSVSASVANVGVGDVFLVTGQSNAEGRASTAQTYSHATLKAAKFPRTADWANLTDPSDSDRTTGGSVWPQLATLLLAETGVPVAFVTTADGSTALVTGTPGWAKGGLQYESAVRQYLLAKTGGCKAVLWHQGEQDAFGGVAQATYQTALSALVDNLQTDLGIAGLQLVAAQIGIDTVSGATAASINGIRLAIADRWDNDPDILAGLSMWDMSLGDGLHATTNAQVLLLAQRWFRMLEYHFYGGSDGRGPRFSSATQFSSTQIDVTFTGGAGSLVLGASPALGWAVTDGGGAKTISSVTLLASNQVRVTVSTALSGSVTISLGSGNTGAGSTLKDSGTYPLPPETFISQAVT